MENKFKQFGAILSVALFSSLFSVFIYQKLTPETTIVSSNNAPPKYTNVALKEAGLTNFEYAADLSVNAVVHIKTSTIYSRQVDPLYEFFYGRPQRPQQHAIQSAGSGVILSNDGYIVTNNHVVDNASSIDVTLNNKKTYKAEVIGTDASTDLALLKIDAENLPYINYGNSNDLNIGAWVLAVGNPFNLTSTVTAGIISAKARNINILSGNQTNGLPPIESFIQTDAVVNPGNSGGALVNVNGELVGINTAIQSNTGSYTGYSFAIPSNIVQKVVKDLKEFGTVQRAFIGVSIKNIDDKVAKDLGLKDYAGVYVNEVNKNGSADKAGIKSRDVIKKVGNNTINDVPELQEQISQFRPGEKTSITVLRDNKLLDFDLVLKNLNGNEEVITYEENTINKILGARLADLTKEDKKELNLENGVKVEEVFAGKLRSIGVRDGFIITKINHVPIKNLSNASEVLSKIKGGVLIEGIYGNGKREFYGFGV